MTGVIKTTGNTRIFCPRVFRVRFVPNQSYSPECDREHLSPSSMCKVKERTSESIYINIIRLN